MVELINECPSITNSCAVAVHVAASQAATCCHTPHHAPTLSPHLSHQEAEAGRLTPEAHVGLAVSRLREQPEVKGASLVAVGFRAPVKGGQPKLEEGGSGGSKGAGQGQDVN